MLEQMVTSPMRGQNILDIFFTTFPTLVDDISVIPGLSDHDIVLAQVNVKPEEQSRSHVTSHCIRKPTGASLSSP